jgi:hypothetical protein
MERKMRTRRAANRRLPGPRPGHFALGSLQSRAAARLMILTLEAEAQDQRNALCKCLTPRERAFIDTLGGDVNPVSVLMARAWVAKAEKFGTELPELRASKESAAVGAQDASLA